MKKKAFWQIEWLIFASLIRRHSLGEKGGAERYNSRKNVRWSAVPFALLLFSSDKIWHGGLYQANKAVRIQCCTWHISLLVG